MPRLMDMGLDQLNGLLLNMADLSQQAVASSIDAYARGGKGEEVKQMADRLQSLHRQVSDLAMEMIARYQPVATDLRFLRSCMEISYGFFRYGRYAYDITQVLDVFGDLGRCDQASVIETARKTQEMIRMSVEAFARRDVDTARRIPTMDDTIDESYRENLRKTIDGKGNLKCSLSATLILRYLERIADHASYIGESVEYIATGVEPSL
ncbi:MAG: phosphate uptake regulator, PhoU [Nitrososphaerota archaeon]|nr:phosphate uptake regulator, PhoU [Nitrososphaerota archaeon]MDG7024650.1 phosphate uptake regulator, PhoU [Nitrososphaerota archaeon]